MFGRLEADISGSSLNELPFLLKAHVIEDLKETSDKFKNLCVEYDGELYVLVRKT